MTTPQLTALPHLAILDVTGDDAQAFLHAQVPSDIRTLNHERAQISGWCTAKGRLLTTFVIWPIENGYRLVLSSDVRDAIAKRLKMYVLRLKVQVIPATDLVYGLLHPGATLANLPLPTTDWQVTRQDEMTAVRLDSTRVLLTGPENQFQALTADLACASQEDWLRADIAQGFPLVTQATSEHYVPQMVNLDKLGGVSFKKGCYPGQEIVARTHYLGKIKRHLYRVSSEQPLLSGAEVRSAVLNGQACGSLLTVVSGLDGNWHALAVLQQDATEGALYLQTEAGEQAITLIDLVLPEAAEART
ncbi:MAG: YgfZ/GcvT domain-containing protein [Fluviibacter phosphoraccumulans]